MKIEINIARNGDGNPCVVVSSPSKEEIIVKEVSEEWYNDIDEDNLKTIVENDIPSILADEDTNTGLYIGVMKPGNDDPNKRHAMYLYGDIKERVPEEIYITGISKKQYKRFLSLDLLQKL